MTERRSSKKNKDNFIFMHLLICNEHKYRKWTGADNANTKIAYKIYEGYKYIGTQKRGRKNPKHHELS